MIGGFRSDKDKRIDELMERIETLESTAHTQAKVHIEIQKHIGGLHQITQDIRQKGFVQQQQLSITHRKVEEVEQLIGVLEQEANSLRVDGNAHRDAIAGLSQRIDNLYTAFQRLSEALSTTRLFGAEK